MVPVASSRVVPLPAVGTLIPSPRTNLSLSITSYAFNPTPISLHLKREMINIPRCISNNFPTLHNKFLKLLESEIKSNQPYLERKMPAAPADFPFTIEDDSCEFTINLRREIEGEKIDVEVSMPYCPQCLSELDADDPELVVTLFVEITKENETAVQFCVKAGADGILVCNKFSSDSNHAWYHVSMSVILLEAGADGILVCNKFSSDSNHAWYHVDVESDLHVALLEFLETRGIGKSNVGFLPRYMVVRFKRGPMLALEKLKVFIEEY